MIIKYKHINLCYVALLMTDISNEGIAILR